MSDRQSGDDGRRRKPQEYEAGKEAAGRFAAAMKSVLTVPKERIVELEAKEKHRR